MNVRLPNGRMVFDVPDDVSNEELKQISIDSGWATAQDFEVEPEPVAPVIEEPEEETSVLGYAGEFAKAVPRGFASGFLSSAEGIAELADAATNAVGLDDLIDSGEENELVRLARDGRKAINESFLGADELYQDAWTTKLGEGVGSLATFLTPGVLARVAGAAGKGVKAIEYGGTAALAGGAGAGDQAQRIQAAKDAGLDVSQATEDSAIVLGTAVGLSEMALPLMLFRRFDKVADGTIKREALDRVKSALKSGSTEAVQESVAGITQDLIEKGLYNENLPVGQSFMDDLTVGGAVGALADLVLTSAAGRRAKIAEDSQKAKDQEQAAQEARDLENLRAGVAEEQAIQQELDDYVASSIAASQAAEAQARAGLERDVAGFEALALEAQQQVVDAETIAAKEAEIRQRRAAEADPEGVRPVRGKDYSETIQERMGAYFPTSAKFELREVSPSELLTPEQQLEDLRRRAEARRAGEEVVEDQAEPLFQVVETTSGKAYGVPVNKAQSVALMDGLNKKVISNNIVQQAVDAMDISSNTYTPEQAEKLLIVHKRVMEPEAHTFTAAAVNEAAGTTYLATAKDGSVVSYPETATFDQIIELTGKGSLNESDMTAAIRINNRREAQGFPPADSFTFEEASQVLSPDQMQDLVGISVKARTESEVYRPVTLRNKKGEVSYAVETSAGERVTTRPSTEKERADLRKEGLKVSDDYKIPFKSRREALNYAQKQNSLTGVSPVPKDLANLDESATASIQKLLDAKNIDAKVNSREVQAIAKAFSGKSTVAKMSKPERELFYYHLRALPKFEQPTKLPKNFFNLKKFTRQQYNAAKQAVVDTGDVSVERIRQASGLLADDQVTNDKVDKIVAELKDQGVLNETGDVVSRIKPLEEIAPVPEPTVPAQQATPAPLPDQPNMAATNSSIEASNRNADQTVELQTNKASRDVESLRQAVPDQTSQAVFDETVAPAMVDRAATGLPDNSFSAFEAPTVKLKDKILFQVADKLIGLKNLEAAINKGREAAGLRPISSLESAYQGEESVAGKIGEEGRVFDREEVTPIIEDLVAMNTERTTQEARKEFDDFLLLRHALERNKKIAQINKRYPDAGAGSIIVDGTATPLTNAYVKQRMKEQYNMDWNDADGTWSGGNTRAKQLQRVAAKTDAIVQRTIDRAYEGGLYTDVDKETLSELYKYYVPLKGRSMEEDMSVDIDPELAGSPTAGSSGTLSIQGREGKRAKGRTSAAESPLATIIADRQRTIARATKNTEVGQRMYDLVKNNPNPDAWVVYDKDSPRFKEYFETSYTYLPTGEKKSKIPEGISKKERQNYVKKLTNRMDNSPDNQLFGAKINGEQVLIDFKDDQLRRGLLNLDTQSTGKIINALGKVNRMLSTVNTSLNPEFVVGNFARDIQTAVYNILGEQSMPMGKAKDTKIVKRVVKDTMPSIKAFYRGFRNSPKQTEKEAQDYKEYIQAGAKADWFYSREPQDQLKTIEDLIDMEKGDFKGTRKKAMKSIVDYVEDTNSAVENGVRFASFKAARDQFLENGMDRDEAIAQAASLAKNLTVNFNRSGMMGAELNSLYLFFNASVQGTMNFARGMNVFDPRASRLKQGIVGSMVGAGALAAALAEAQSEEDDNGKSFYMNIPDYVKERNIVIMKPNGKDYYTIPLPYGYNAFHVLGQNIYETVAGLKSVEDGSTMVTKTFLGSFNPVGVSSSKDFMTGLVKTGSPTILDPVVEILANENFFGSPVFTTAFPGQNIPDSQMAKSSTNEHIINAAKFINSFGGNENESGFIDFSPDAAQHIFNFALGGAGATGLRTLTALEKFAADEDISVNDMPFVRRIMGEVDHRTSQEDFYERRADIKAKVKQAEFLQGAGRAQARRTYLEENMPFISMNSSLKASESQIRKINKRLRALRARAKENPAAAIQLAEQEERLEEMKKAVYDRFNKRYSIIVGN